MKNLIVYFSFTNNNRVLSQELANRLNCDILEIEEINTRTNWTLVSDIFFNRDVKLKPIQQELNNYDNIIFITPIWNSKLANPMKSFIKTEKNNINSYSFITISSGRPRQKQKISKQLTKITNKQPKTVAELMINDLLPLKQKNKIKYTSTYKINPQAISTFKIEIDNFINSL